MFARRVYLETSIPSVLFDTRDDPRSVVCREWTEEWMRVYRPTWECVSSQAVLDELRRGDYPNKNRSLGFMAGFPLLPLSEDIAGIVDHYILHKLMPADPLGDALHLAISSFHKCDYLLTWNCAHLANRNKREHMRHVNMSLGLIVPEVLSPVDFLSVESPEGES